MRKRTKKTARKPARKTKARKTAKKTKSRKTRRSSKTAKKSGKKKMSGASNSLTINRKAHWDAYKQLQKRCGQAWKKLQADVKRKASPDVIVRDKNHLLLLLGECDYMARECMQFSSRKKR